MKIMPKMYYHKRAGQYVVCITSLGRQRTFYLGKDKELAESKYHVLVLQYKNNKIYNSDYTGQNTLFCVLANKYLEYRKREIEQSTWNGYRSRLSVVGRLYPMLKLSDIDADFIYTLREYLLSQQPQGIRKKFGVGNDTCNRYIQVIKTVIDWSISNKFIKPYDVCLPNIKKLTVFRKDPVFFNEEEIRKILSCETMSYPGLAKKYKETTIRQTFDIIKFMLYTGRRIQEVICFRKCDFNLELKYCKIPISADKTKRTGKEKTYYLSDTAINIIKQYIDLCTSDTELLFKNESGDPLTTNATRQRMQRIFKLVGIDNVTSKEFRHTFASHMLLQGATLTDVQHNLGHTDVRTTQIYAHLTKKHLLESVNNLRLPL